MPAIAFVIAVFGGADMWPALRKLGSERLFALALGLLTSLGLLMLLGGQLYSPL